MSMSQTPPPIGVLRAFGVDGAPVRLPGGQGTSWLAGDVVFKFDEGTCHDWLGVALTPLEPHDVRIAKPVATRHGAWRQDGWIATRWVAGLASEDASTRRWRDILE